MCGKPVVATSVGGIDEQLGDCGVLVEPRNHAELAQALLGMVNDPGGARRLGESAREEPSASSTSTCRTGASWSCTPIMSRDPDRGAGRVPGEHPQ